MPVVNPLARELVFKIVYYGPGLGGKTTTLQYIHNATRPEHRGKMVSLATPVDRTLYFDFLPIRVPNLRGLGVRLQLFTVPGQVYYNATRKLVLTGADAVVFVADSQRARLDANLESLENLRDNLREHGRSLEELPFALAYNKRDLDDVVSLEDLEQRMNATNAPSFTTCATRGEGVFETLDAVARMVLDDFEQRMPESRSALAVEGFGLAEGGLIDALRLADTPSAEPAPEPHVEVAAPPAPEPEPAAEVMPVDGELAARALTDEPRQLASEAPPAPALQSVWPASEPPPAPPSFRPPRPSVRPAAPSYPPRPSAFPRAEPSAPPRSPSIAPDELHIPREPAVPAPSPSFRPPAPESFARPAAQHLTFLAVWPEEDRALAREVEGNLARGEASAAVLGVGSLVRRSLSRVAGHDENEGVVLTVLAMGIDGARYLWLRRSITQIRSGTGVSREDALLAYAFALDVSRRCRG